MKGTGEKNVWIAPAPVWTRTSIFSSERLFAGYGVGVYNRTGIVDRVGSHTFPLAIWQKMARETVEKAQGRHDQDRNATRSPDKQIKVEACFT